MTWIVEFLGGVLKFALGFVGVAGMIAFYDWYDTTERLRKYVSLYVNYAEFEWTNQSDEFVLTHRVRAFELLLRNLDDVRPWTLPAFKRVEAVRDVVEYFHRRAIPILGDKHLPLPKLGEFPYPLSQAVEAHVTNHVLEGLRAIKWLELEKRTE